MGQEKSNVTNVYGNRENQLSPEQMDELLKLVCATGIYYPQQLPAEATATHIQSLLGPRKHTRLPLRQLYAHSAWAEHVIYPPALMLIALTHYHYNKHKTCNKTIPAQSEISGFFSKWTCRPKTHTLSKLICLFVSQRRWSNDAKYLALKRLYHFPALIIQRLFTWAEI